MKAILARASIPVLCLLCIAVGAAVAWHWGYALMIPALLVWIDLWRTK